MYLLFTVPHCPQCVAVKKKLKELNIQYKEIPVMENEKNMELAKKYGVRTGGTIIDNTTGDELHI